MTRNYVTGGRAGALIALVIVALLSAYLLYPALFLDRSLVHSDNLHHSYALLKFHHDVIHEGLSPLWTNLVYGGHPLFAEGQAGLSNPINYLVAWLFAPEFGHNLIHWLAMVIFGAGCYGLARSLSISATAAIIATLAATFSGLILHTNTNMTGVGAVAWIPWTLWAFEAWIKQPDARRGIAFGLSVAMQVFAGYPQFLHGTVIYMAVSMVTLPAGNSIPELLRRYWRSGLVAIVLAVGISSIQWLPLLELASLSHRQEGVAIGISGNPSYLLRGLFFALDPALGDLPNPYFPNTGSLIVCFLALLVLTLPSSPRVKGHILASVLLLNLGLGDGSPVYEFIKNYHLIPGLENFRITYPYFMLSLTGMAIMAACSVDMLSRLNSSQAREWLLSWRLWTVVLVFGLAMAMLHHPEAPSMHYVVLLLGVSALVCMAIKNTPNFLPLSVLGLLLLEIILLKVTPLGTVAISQITSPPPLARHILAQEDFMDFKHYHTGVVALGFTGPYSSKLAGRTSHELRNLVGSSSLLWGIPSFTAALALKSHRKPIANAVIEQDLLGHHDDLKGDRLMDRLSVRWVSKKPSTTSEHLVRVRDSLDQEIGWENTGAKPLIQIYHNTRWVDGPEAAAEAIKAQSASILFLEGEPPRDTGPSIAASPRVDIDTLTKAAGRYEFVTSADAGFWLFLSDTYHPGWKAAISGEETRIYPAQVLGKAIYVPPGNHEVTIYFQSDSFRIGATASFLSLVGLVLYCMLRIIAARGKILRQDD